MAAKGAETPKPNEAEKAPAEASPAAAGAAAPASTGGVKAWLPLIINVVLMPALAYLTVSMLLAPKTKSEAASAKSEHGAPAAEKSSEHGEASIGELGKSKFMKALSGKVLVNVAGTMGTRYLLANLTLVSPKPGLGEIVEKNDAELRDVAASVLATKTIADLEKPGARNLIRTELISVFNNVLGDGIVTELYLTEFAIQ